MEKDGFTIPQMVDAVRSGKFSRRRLIKALGALGVSAGGIGAIIAATHRAAPPVKPATHTPASQSENEQMQLHDQHLANQQSGDINALHHDYADHAIVEDSMYSAPFVGRAAIMQRKQHGMMAIPDVQIAVTNRIVHDNQLTVEWTATGTHKGDFPGLPASGRPFSIHGVTVVVRENGKIVRESIYYDMAEVHRQLGAR